MYSQIDRNKTKTFFLLIFFIVIVVFFTYTITYFWTGGDRVSGIGVGIIAFLFSFISSLISYFAGASIVLAMNRAVDVSDDPRYAELNSRLETLSIKAGIPKPKIYILPDMALNAFATGRDPKHAHVAVTQGLLQQMEWREIEAVIAHEIGHIRNYDIRLMLIVSVLAGVLTYVADFFLRSLWWGGGRSRDDNNGSFGVIGFVLAIFFAILAPIVASLIQLAISRRREFLADMTSVEITRDPQSMVNALKVLAGDDTPVATATEGTAQMFIDFPLKDSGSFIKKLFSTHPPIEERIAALQKLI
jgi:heat shock protein HtpX